MWIWLTRLYEDAAAGRLGPTHHPVFRWLVEGVHLAIVLFRETVRDRLHVRAAMLAYWSAVAIVPILLIGFALTGVFGLKEGTKGAVMGVLYDTILASSVEEVGGAVDTLLAGTNLGTFGIVGVLGIMFIGAQLYFNVELAYNDIFRTKIRRSWILRFTLFYAAITLGPLLLASGFVLTARLGAAQATPLLTSVLPIFLTGTLLVGALRLLPCSPVSWRSALAGGLVSAVLFEFMKHAFGFYTDLLGTRTNMAIIYGSLSMLPVFLLWMYVVWLVVLFGVEVAYLTEHRSTLVEAQRRLAIDRNADRRTADAFFGLAVMSTVAEAFQTRRGGITARDISRDTGSDPRHVQVALEVLQDTGLITQSDAGRYLPTQPPQSISASQVLRAWRSLAAPEVHGPAAGASRTAQAAVDGALSVGLGSLTSHQTR